MEAKLPEYRRLQQEAANENTRSDRLEELARVSPDLACLVAQNSSAPPGLLRELGTSRDAATRQNVAANPNTPTEVLLRLGGEFPEQLLDNPLFPLLLLENPNLVDEIPLTTLRSLLKQERVPVSFLEQAANKRDLEVQLAVAMNAQTPKTVLEKLLRSRYAQVVEASSLHVNWAAEMTQGWDEAAREAIKATDFHEEDWEYLEELAKIGISSELILENLHQVGLHRIIRHFEQNLGHQSLEFKQGLFPEDRKYEQVLQAIAISAKTPLNVLENLAKNSNSDIVRASVAQNPNTPAYLLEQLAAEDAFVCQFAVRHPNMPVSLLEQWAKHKDKTVRYAIVRNPNLPVSLLEQWAKQVDRYDSVWIAKLPETPVRVLEQLGKHEKVAVRIAVAQNPNTPVHLLEQWAGSEDVRLRSSVAQNPNTPQILLEQLAKDEEAQVRKNVAQNPNTPGSILLGQLARDGDATLCEIIAGRVCADDSSIIKNIHHLLTKNSNTPESLLEKLASHENKNVRYFIGYLPDAPLHLREQLAKDGDFMVRKAVAKNSNTPGNLLGQLAKDNNMAVREAVAKNPNTHTSILEQLLGDPPVSVRTVAVKRYLAQNHEGLPLVLQSYVKDSTPFFSRLLVLLHPQTPSKALADRFRSNAWLERYAIAQNPNTPPATLKTLVEDGNRIVRAAARANLQNRTQQL